MGHDHEYSDIHRPVKWKNIEEIPDSMVKTYSKRDPNNPIYQTRRWVNFKKSQLFHSQLDGKEYYLRDKWSRRAHIGLSIGVWVMFAATIYHYNKYIINPKKK